VADIAFQQCRPKPQQPLQLAPFHEWVLADATRVAQFFRTPDGCLIRFPSLGDFVVSSDGLHVSCWPTEAATEGTIQHLFLNQVLPMARSRSGALMFHASAVAIDDFCVAFVGPSGRGKSTLAAGFASSGFSFLTDDGMSAQLIDGMCRVAPSHPSIRLWEDTLQALGGEHDRALPVQFTTKARLVAGEHLTFCPATMALKHAYVLGDGSAPAISIERLPPSESLVELLRNSFLLDIDEPRALASHFEELVALVQLPLFHRLDYPRRFDDLGLVIAAVVAHARGDDPAGRDR
jgi:hypothetical protein